MAKYGNIDSPKDIDNLWNVIYDSGELGAAQTTITIPNLEGDTDEEYRLIIRGVSDAVSQTSYLLRFNSDSGANYGYQRIVGNGASAVAFRQTGQTSVNLSLYSPNTNELSLIDVPIYVKSGFERTGIAFVADGITGTTVQQIGERGFVWDNTANELTSISITSSIANGLGIGSRIILLKKTNIATGLKTGLIEPQGKIYGVWEKIYEEEVTVAKQTTTISSLTGDTDVLYKLIVRPYNASTSTGYLVRLNNDSGSNYGSQLLQGTAAVVAASRNTALTGYDLTDCNTSTSAIAEVLIYAKSGYERVCLNKTAHTISGTTVTSIRLFGEVWSNTANEITSIVVRSNTASGLGVGTHIELWRLNL